MCDALSTLKSRAEIARAQGLAQLKTLFEPQWHESLGLDRGIFDSTSALRAIEEQSQARQPCVLDARLPGFSLHSFKLNFSYMMLLHEKAGQAEKKIRNCNFLPYYLGAAAGYVGRDTLEARYASTPASLMQALEVRDPRCGKAVAAMLSAQGSLVVALGG